MRVSCETRSFLSAGFHKASNSTSFPAISFADLKASSSCFCSLSFLLFPDWRIKAGILGFTSLRVKVITSPFFENGSCEGQFDFVFSSFVSCALYLLNEFCRVDPDSLTERNLDMNRFCSDELCFLDALLAFQSLVETIGSSGSSCAIHSQLGVFDIRSNEIAKHIRINVHKAIGFQENTYISPQLSILAQLSISLYAVFQ